MEHNMLERQKHTELLRTLAECATECENCFDSCLENKRTEELVKQIRLCRDCAKICYTTSSFIASNSAHAKHLAKECAEICRECAKACSNKENVEDELSPCAKICRECEEACKKYAA